ncbi:hypothetical protein [Psychroserpens sp.]|uniref:hypothetical protein n=1 Tax=Psychroserpens sp. TaxID=2020870 RepID=UPI0039E3BD42
MKYRNNERWNEDAKRSFKHVIPEENVPQEFPHFNMIFWFALHQGKVNRNKK